MEKKKTLREQVQEVLDGGGMWIDVANNKAYTSDNASELPSEADFAKDNPEEATQSLSDMRKQMMELQDKMDAVKSVQKKSEPKEEEESGNKTAPNEGVKHNEPEAKTPAKK